MNTETPRILFSDIDGTLLNAERQLSSFTISEIKRIKEQIPIVLISSRMPRAMRHLQKDLDILNQPIICYNGGLILVNDEIISSTFIPPEIISELAAFNHGNEFHISLYHNDDWYVPEIDYWAKREINNTKVQPTVKNTDEVITDWKNTNKGAHKIMCMGDETPIGRAYEFLEKNFSDSLHLYRSKSTYIEIAHKAISKQTAVKHLLQSHFDIPIANAIAFGDNYNDITMLQAVGTGVAVANAKPETLAIANAVTLAGKEDGVATYISNNIKLNTSF